MSERKTLLFLGGFGAPVAAFLPWFAKLRSLGYRVRPVPNSVLGTDPVSHFARSLIDLAASHERVDVIGISYGGNAALYGAYLDPELRAKVERMVVVCAPLLGVPPLVPALRKVVPSALRGSLDELAPGSEIARALGEPGFHAAIDFDLHCLYHREDLIAPQGSATLPGVGTHHDLSPRRSAVPRLVVHQTASAGPGTFRRVLEILGH